MAGHSKWKNIQHRKNRQDAKKGKIFTKLIRDIIVAAKNGGEDISGNFALRTAVEKAYASNMSKDTVDKAIKRGISREEGQNEEDVRYEGYWKRGIAVIVDCRTDNRKRSASNVRHVFSKHGGSLSTTGSVVFGFEEKAFFICSSELDENSIMEIILDIGAGDVDFVKEGKFEVMAESSLYYVILRKFEEIKAIKVEESFISMVPLSQEEISNAEEASKFVSFLNALEDLDDVYDVYSNADIKVDI